LGVNFLPFLEASRSEAKAKEEAKEKIFNDIDFFQPDEYFRELIWEQWHLKEFIFGVGCFIHDVLFVASGADYALP
jgi:hypothetical protein